MCPAIGPKSMDPSVSRDLDAKIPACAGMTGEGIAFPQLSRSIASRVREPGMIMIGQGIAPASAPAK